MALYSNEIVFRGHPDKVCDQISDALLTEYLKGDENARCGIEVVGGKGVIFITGEVTANCEVDVKEVVERTLCEIGYQDKMEIIDNIGWQSRDIAQGVDTGGAGDQGMMFGYATCETEYYVPKAMAILQDIAIMYDDIRAHYPETFYPDGKAQITGYYDDEKHLVKIKTLVVSYHNCENKREWSDEILHHNILNILDEYEMFCEEIIFNPTGAFKIGGFEADAGLTGRKIVCDSYHSFAPVGGGAFSGKDPTKVDRSGAYKARQLAVRMLEMCDLSWCTVQLSYAIGIAEPMAIYIESNKGSLQVPHELYEECKPQNIINEFDLKHYDYTQTAKFGHFGLMFPWDNLK